MSFDKKKHVETAKPVLAVPLVKKERLGVFTQPWKLVKRYAPNSMNVHITSFRACQLVFKDEEIDDLLAQGAPIRVYIRDDESNTSSNNGCPKG